MGGSGSSGAPVSSSANANVTFPVVGQLWGSGETQVSPLILLAGLALLVVLLLFVKK